MTTHVSRERREAVLNAILDVEVQWAVSNDPNFDDAWELRRAEAALTAAIAVVLPDLDAMQRRIAEALYVASGLDPFAFYEGSILFVEYMQKAHALVYGSDDAHDGDQEGAEHD